MKQKTRRSLSIPLAIPDDLYGEIGELAQKLFVSRSMIMRMAIKAGLPRVKEVSEKLDLILKG